MGGGVGCFNMAFIYAGRGGFWSTSRCKTRVNICTGIYFTKIERYYLNSRCSWHAEQSMPKSWKRKEKEAPSNPAAEEQVPASALMTMQPSASRFAPAP